MSGLRVVDPDLLALGMKLPGLSRRASALAQLPPLGLLSIAAVVDPGWSIELITDQSTGTITSTIERIIASQPEVVAFSTLSASADRAAQISERLRQRSITTVIGGLHATGIPEWAAERFDVVTTGDGEATLPMVLSDWENNSLRQSYSPIAPVDISKTPLPRWDLWSQAETPRYTVQTMRGCPWACQFCAASRLLGPARAKSRTRIQQELKQIAAMRSRPWIELADDNTFAGDRDSDGFLEDLKNIGAKWFTESDWISRVVVQPSGSVHGGRVRWDVFGHVGFGRRHGWRPVDANSGDHEEFSERRAFDYFHGVRSCSRLGVGWDRYRAAKDMAAPIDPDERFTGQVVVGCSAVGIDRFWRGDAVFSTRVDEGGTNRSASSV